MNNRKGYRGHFTGPQIFQWDLGCFRQPLGEFLSSRAEFYEIFGLLALLLTTEFHEWTTKVARTGGPVNPALSQYCPTWPERLSFGMFFCYPMVRPSFYRVIDETGFFRTTRRIHPAGWSFSTTNVQFIRHSSPDDLQLDERISATLAFLPIRWSAPLGEYTRSGRWRNVAIITLGRV